MKSKKIFTEVISLAAIIGMLAGCGSQVQNNSLAGKSSSAELKDVTSISLDGKKVKEGGALVIGLSSDPDKLDPTTSSSLYSRYIFQNSCEKLYDINAKGAVVPMLATNQPKISSDGLTYTFNVRSDAKFADGTKLDAQAVVQTLERDLTAKGSARKTELGPITSVKATSEYAVQIKLSKPYAPLLASLTDRAGMIMSPKALNEHGDDFGSAPVCVGPYKFENRVPSTSITLVKDPNYYDAKNVHLDKLEYKIIKDSSIRSQNLKSGDVLVADSLTPQDVSSLKSDKSISMMSVLSLGFQGIHINLANQGGIGQPTQQIDTPLAKDKTVRQALEMSIDRVELVKSVFGGMYAKACSFIPENSPYATDDSNSCLPHDPDKAKKMLQDAGVKTPYTIRMQVSNVPSSLQMMQAVQAQAKEGGFDIQIQPVEYTTLLSNMNEGKYDDAAQLGWSGRVDPSGNVTSFLGTGGAMNYTGYSNTKVDDLFDQASATTDIKTRAKLYGQAAKAMQADTPYIYLYRMRYLTGVSAKVAGINVYGDGVLRLSHAALVE